MVDFPGMMFGTVGDVSCTAMQDNTYNGFQHGAVFSLRTPAAVELTACGDVKLLVYEEGTSTCFEAVSEQVDTAICPGGNGATIDVMLDGSSPGLYERIRALTRSTTFSFHPAPPGSFETFKFW